MNRAYSIAHGSGREGKFRRRGFMTLLTVIATAPLYIEVFRRFINGSSYILVLIEFSLLLIFFKRNYRNKFIKIFPYIFMLLFLGIALSITGENLLLLYIGLRPIIFMYIFYCIGKCISEDERELRIFLYHVLFWSFIITSVSIIQVILGSGHWINHIRVPDGTMGFAGAGDTYFSIAGLSVFRPTSIFMHTGKFGQTIFLFFLFSFAYLMIRPGYVARTALLFSLVGIAVSGQRAAMASAVIILGVYLLKDVRSFGKYAFRGMLLLLAAIFLLWIFDPMVAVGIMDGVYDRLASTFGTSGGRFEENAANWDIALSLGGLFGAGIGTYSLGSGIAGGSGSFLAIAENAWMRFVTEWGVVGSAVVAAILLKSVLPLRRPYTSKLVMVNYLALPIALLSVWCLTHDLLANYLTMAYFGLYLGLLNAVPAGARLSKGAGSPTHWRHAHGPRAASVRGFSAYGKATAT